MSMGIVILYVRDLQKSRKFYTENLGLNVVEEQSDENFIMLNAETDTFLALESLKVVPAGRAKDPGSAEIGFMVEDVDGTFAAWKAKGIEILQEPETMPFGRNFMAKDPDGHYLTIYCLVPVRNPR